MRSNSKNTRNTNSSSKNTNQVSRPISSEQKSSKQQIKQENIKQKYKPAIDSSQKHIKIQQKSVANSNKNINKPPIVPLPDNTKNITKTIIKKVEEKTKNNQIQSRYKNKKQQTNMKECKWGFISFSYLAKISQYACSNLIQVYHLSKVCSLWRGHLLSESGCYLWNHLKAGENIKNFAQLKLGLQKIIIANQQKMSFQFQQLFTKLFNYGSTKQNIPNKLIQKLSLQLQITLNNGFSYIQPFKLRTFNFSSYLCAKIQKIKQYKYDFYTPHNMFKDKIDIKMNFKSKRYKVQYKIQKKYVPEEIIDGAIKQKAFNYYLDKNFVFTYFQGDSCFLYIFFEISVLELVNIFRSIIKSKHQQSLDKKVKKLPLYKQLCQTQFQNFEQYVKFQADFEIHFSYHNSLKQIFTHCDTKVFPIEYNKKSAYFQVKINDSFQKVATYKLDNKMGMSQPIDDLYLLDFVLKDRDRFLIIFSGFMYARKASQKQRQSIQNYFDFAQNDIKILQSKQEKYLINFTIIQQAKKNLMTNVKITYYA